MYIVKKKTLAKKWPIAVSICYLAFVVNSYIVQIVGALICIIRSPETYKAIMNANWPITLSGAIYSLITVCFMAVIFPLSQKAGIKWLAIVSKIHLFVYIGLTLLFGIVTLTYL